MKKDGKLPAGGLLIEAVTGSFRAAFEDALSRAGHGFRLDEIRRRARERVIEAVLGCNGTPECWRDRLPASLELANDMMESLARGLDSSGLYGAVVDLAFVLRSPGLVGAGGGLLAGVFEVGLEIDWLLGLPYYPGSTIKGAVRALAEELLSPRAVESIFGSAGRGGRAGSVVFYDAYPVGCLRGSEHPCLILTGGVVTPHYYKGGEPVEAEYEAQPTPVQHIVVAPGTVFRVVAGVDCPRDPEGNVDNEAYRELASKVLGEASDTCSVARYAAAIAALTAAALSRGFAARSAKGYNRLQPIPLDDPAELQEAITTSIARMIVRVPLPAPQRSGPKQGPRGVKRPWR